MLVRGYLYLQTLGFNGLDLCLDYFLLFLLIILILAKVRNLANWRHHVRGYLQKVQAKHFRFHKRVPQGNNSEILTGRANNPELRRLYLMIYSDFYITQLIIRLFTDTYL